MKRKYLSMFLIAILCLSLVACNSTDVSNADTSAEGSQESAEKPSDNESENTEVETNEEVEKVKVIATLFPQYDFAKIIGGDKAEVSLILPPGVEPHSYEPTPRDIVRIGDADILAYTGESMEPWVHTVAEKVADKNTEIVDLSKDITFISHDSHEEHQAHAENIEHDDHDHESHDDHDHESHDDHDHESHDDHDHESHDDHDHESLDDDHDHESHDDHDHESHDADHDHESHDDHADEAHEAHEDHGHDHTGDDPHIWLNPLYAKIMVENLTEGFVKVDPENKAYYEMNRDNYLKELDLLDKDFEEALNHVESRTIIYGGHFAFSYFVDRYNLAYKSPYTGFAPDAEPTPQRIAELIDTIKETNAKTIFFEELVEPKVAKVLSEQTGAELLLLHAAHNVNKDEIESGTTYIEIMRGNLERLKDGLGYHE